MAIITGKAEDMIQLNNQKGSGLPFLRRYFFAGCLLSDRTLKAWVYAMSC